MSRAYIIVTVCRDSNRNRSYVGVKLLQGSLWHILKVVVCRHKQCNSPATY